MSVTELKKRIHASIDQIDDNDLLNTVYDILENGNKMPEDLLANNAFLDRLELGMKDIENGRTISLKDSNSKIYEWLTK